MKKSIRQYFLLSVKGWSVFLLTMGMASLTCLLLRTVASSDTHVPMIFVLAVLVTALMTEGYFYGFMASVISVFAVNWAFTFPYMKLDFTIYGYPLTFLTMLAVGVAVSTLATRLKAQEKIKAESEQEKTRANLLRAVSHDLRTPLTSISGTLGLVLDNETQLEEQERRQLLAEAKKDAEWLCSMVENLLSITRMSGGPKAKLNVEPELLEEVISETVAKFRNRNPDISICVSVPDELIFVPMDAMLIEQVMYNLLDNAAIHGGHTDRIDIRVCRRGEMAEISVMDNGVGIREELLPLLFEGGDRLSNLSHKDDNRFMGIGLSVCSTIIAAHDGTINAENVAGGGARFYFTLPVAKDGEMDSQEDEA